MDNNVAEVDDLDKATSRLFYDNRNQFIRDFQRFMGKKELYGCVVVCSYSGHKSVKVVLR